MAHAMPFGRAALREQQGRSPTEIIRPLVRRAAATARLWQRRAAMRGDLACLNDRMLADVGLTREQVARESRKPFWRA